MIFFHIETDTPNYASTSIANQYGYHPDKHVSTIVVRGSVHTFALHLYKSDYTLYICGLTVTVPHL